MNDRQRRRAIAWAEMAELAASGLGRLVEVSPARRKVVLRVNHPHADLLTTRPEADGFIRADEDSLLFRDAAQSLIDAVPWQIVARQMDSSKGLEFRWTALSNADIRLLHATIRWLAETGGEAPGTNVA